MRDTSRDVAVEKVPMFPSDPHVPSVITGGFFCSYDLRYGYLLRSQESREAGKQSVLPVFSATVETQG